MTRRLLLHPEDLAASAALFALGSLQGEQKAIFEQHIAEGCGICGQNLLDLAAVTESLALAAPPAEPSAVLRRKLIERTRPWMSETSNKTSTTTSHRLDL